MIKKSVLNRKDLLQSVKQLRKEKRTARNDECPCGSGLKYKMCCMRVRTLEQELQDAQNENQS